MAEQFASKYIKIHHPQHFSDEPVAMAGLWVQEREPIW